MSFSQMRPRTSQLVELHVFYVPEEVWNFKLNTVPVALTRKFISAGFIRWDDCNELSFALLLKKHPEANDSDVTSLLLASGSKVSPHITLRVLREKLGEYLGGVAVADKFKFLKCIGKKLAVGHGNLTELHLYDQIFVEWFSTPPSLLFHNTSNPVSVTADQWHCLTVTENLAPCLVQCHYLHTLFLGLLLKSERFTQRMSRRTINTRRQKRVKAKQETELELKSFAPPYALYPELYLLPGVEYFEDVYPLSSSTQERHHFNAEANRFSNGSRLSSLPQQKPEKRQQFLGSIHSSHQPENQEVHSPVEWGEKEPVPVLHRKHKQDHNNRIQEKQIQFREKDQNGSNGSLFTPGHSNPADWESGKSGMVLEASQQNHLSQGQKHHNTPKWNDKAEGTALTLRVNHTDEEGQNNHTPQNHIKYQKELTNMENNDDQEDTKLRRDRTQDAGILKVREDQTTEYVCKNQSLQQYRTSKSIADSGEKLDNQADENKQNHLTLLKECVSPPSPPFLALAVNPAQVPTIQAAKNKMVEQLQQMKKDRRHMEKTREELIRKAKGLLEQNKLRRYHVREEWKKKYFETKKTTVSLEDALNKLRQDLELYHQKLLLQLEARGSRQQPNNMTNSKNYTVIRIATVQHELDQLRRKLDDTKMKLVIEIKMRKQAASDLRALRAELTQKKIHSALILQSRKSGV